MKTFVSDLSKKRFPMSEKISAESVRTSIMQLIRNDYPDFDSSKSLSLTELNHYREKYITSYLDKQIGDFSDLDEKVLASLNNKTLISGKTNDDDQVKPTTGQRVADKVASFGGSWTFIIMFLSAMVLWILLNVFWFTNDAFDPYPFILLNLVLSCLAAIQAPIIMMSQNRQGEKDRKRAEDDYMVNLKSELELKSLHEKIDHLMLHQQQELIEIQKMQIDMLTDIEKRLGKKHDEYAAVKKMYAKSESGNNGE